MLISFPKNIFRKNYLRQSEIACAISEVIPIENLEYVYVSDKYGQISYTTRSPFLNIHHAEESKMKIINGYPHVFFPHQELFKFVEEFLDKRDYTLFPLLIRFGDLHVDAPTPKLAHLRNFFLGDTIQRIYTQMGGNVTSIVGLGDVGNSMENMLSKLSCKNGCNGVSPMDCYYQICKDARERYNASLQRYNISYNKIVFDSDVYCGMDGLLKKYPSLQSEFYIRKNGMPKYILQEVLWWEYCMRSMPNAEQIYLIANNQSEHLQNIKSTIQIFDMRYNVNYLSYAPVIHGASRDEATWFLQIKNAFPKKLAYKLDGINISRMLDIYKAITIMEHIDTEIDMHRIPHTTLKMYLDLLRAIKQDDIVIAGVREGGSLSIDGEKLLYLIALTSYIFLRAIEKYDLHSIIMHLNSIVKLIHRLSLSATCSGDRIVVAYAVKISKKIVEIVGIPDLSNIL